MGIKKEDPHHKGSVKKEKNEKTKSSKKNESKNTEISKKNKHDVSKKDQKKNKNDPTKTKTTKEQKKQKENKESPRKVLNNHKKNSLVNKKTNIKDHDKNKEDEKNIKIKNIEQQEQKTQGSCFLCFCCSCADNTDTQTELLLEDLKRREEEEEEMKKKLELELKKKEEEAKRKEEEARRKEEEAKKKKEEEEEIRKRIQEEEEETKLSENEKIDDETIVDEDHIESQPKTVLKKIGIKAKQPPKKAKLNFIGAAAAPPPPPISACVGPPPKVKSTKVNLGEGVYLVYDSEKNNGQLKLCYSKHPINKNGVLAYISSKTIPPFYFEQNHGENILLNNVSNIMQSTFINDRKSYYEHWIQFIKMTKKFNGTLYLLPGSDAQPPPKMEIVFLDSNQKKIYPTQIEKPINFQGDCLLVIHHGLNIFKKEINVTDILSYIGNYGAYSEI